MNLKISAILLIAILFFSCKRDKKADNKEDLTVKEANNFLKVALDLKVLKDDNFHLYYTEDGTINFNEKQSIWLPVKGNASQQEIFFKLPVDIVPTHLRIDFGLGKNETQSDITLKAFRMNYFDKKFEALDSKIFDYFYPNEASSIVDKSTSTLKRIKKDQDTGPSLYPHISLSEEINKLVK